MSLEEVIEDAVRRAVRDEVRKLLSEYPRGVDDRRVSRTEAAAAAGVSPATISAWVADGRVKRYGEGRNSRFSLAEVLAVAPRPAEVKTTPGQRASEIFRRHHG